MRYYSVKKRRARKAHTCGECRETIASGSQYYYHSQFWEGEWCDHKICESCDALEGRVIDESPSPYRDEGYYEWGALHEAAKDMELI